MNFNMPVEDDLFDDNESDVDEVDNVDEVSDDNEEQEDDDNVGTQQEQSSGNNQLESLLEAFVERGIIPMPDGEVDRIESIEDFFDIIEDKIVNKSDYLKELNKKLPDTAKLVLQQALKGDMDIDDFIKGLVYNTDINKLSTDDLADCKAIIYEHGLLKKIDEESLEELIDLLSENPDKLKKYASKVFTELKELSANTVKKKMEHQAIIEEEERSKDDFFTDRLVAELKKQQIKIGDDIIPIDKKDAELLIKASSELIKMKIKGKVVEMPTQEALVHYHKYHKDGNVQNYMLSVMALENPNKLFAYFKEQAKKEVLKESRSEVKKSTSITFTKPKEIVQSKRPSSDLDLLTKIKV